MPTRVARRCGSGRRRPRGRLRRRLCSRLGPCWLWTGSGSSSEKSVTYYFQGHTTNRSIPSLCRQHVVDVELYTQPAIRARRRHQGTGASAVPQSPKMCPRNTLETPCCPKAMGSMISTSVMRVFVMCVCTPDRPCHVGPAPAPPAMVS